MDIYSSLEIPAEHRTTSISKEEGDFIQKLLQEKGFKDTLEVGFAYGCSAAYIMSATQSRHIAIDPYQDAYRRLGLKNLSRLGLLDRLDHREQLSHIALPELLREGKTLDFAFIDGDHKFDTIFVDFYFIDLLLRKGGMILFDDAWMRSTQMVCSFIRENRADYREISTTMENFFLFEKIGDDRREWHHYKEFYTEKGKDLYENVMKRMEEDKTLKGVKG